MAESSGGAGRMLFRLFSLLVIAAAGVGGWFAYDWLLGEPEADAENASTAAPDSAANDQVADGGLDSGLLGDDPLAETARDPLGASTPPWPADIVPASRPWSSFVTTHQSADGVVSQQMAFDGLTKQTQMKLFGADGAQVGTVEVRGTETWSDEGAGWQPIDVANGGLVAGAAHDDVVPPTLSGLLPAPTWPHVTLVSDVADPEVLGVRRLEFEIDHDAFTDADPMGASEWREGLPVAVENPQETWLVDVNAAGHVVRFEFESGDLVASFSELVQPIIFTSPLVAPGGG